MRVFIEDTFDAAHSLPHLPKEHKCHNLHGHTYRVRLEYTGPINPYTGWIVDYGVLKSQWGTVKDGLDHQFLNEKLTISTCESLVVYIAVEIQSLLKKFGPPAITLARIELRETEKCGVVCELD